MSQRFTRQESCTSGRARPAFTVAELVIVVLIIGIMAAVSAPRFTDTLQFYRVDAAAKRIQLDLELARRDAQAKSANRSVVFSTATNSYTLPNVSHLDRYRQTYSVKLSDTHYVATLVSADFGGDQTVVFNGYGVPDSGGTAVVRSGQRVRTVSLDAHSGKATIQ